MKIRGTARLPAIWAVCLLAVFGVIAATPSLAQMSGGGKKEAKDLALRGDAVCTRCHDETEAYPVLAIGKTKHGTRADRRTPTCTSCHGESPTHVNKPANAKDRPKVDRAFGKKSATPVSERNAACMQCHEGGERMLWAGSTHDSRDIACTSCHQVHTGHDRVRDRVTQTEVCFTCHKTQRVKLAKPYRHPIPEGKVVCSDCHNPHGSAGPALMARDTVNDTCFQCHAEKRGPFLWNHWPVTENCGLCHDPHGTTVASLLKFRPPFLCQECHEPTSHRGGIPNIFISGGTSGTGITLARSCMNCHTNIHGGNNPVNNAASRTLRR